MKLRILSAGALILGSVWSCRAQMTPPLAPTIEPTQNSIFTSTREVRDLQTAGAQTWAATSGGVLHLRGGVATKWTRQTGLPANEAFEIDQKNGQINARFARGGAAFDGTRWSESTAAPIATAPIETQFNAQTVRATLDGLVMADKKFALPAESQGTHISALWNGGTRLVVAIYGDGLWEFRTGKTPWQRAPEGRNLPEQAREITALAGGADPQMWLGTRRDGIFQLREGKWQQQLQPNEPFGHNIQFFGEFRGVLWASTLDDGLIYRSGAQWGHVSASELSSSAPRQMVEFQNQLFVRHGGGLVDSFDGRSWTKNALISIPRRGVYALAANEKTLFAAGWGGWSEWDGTNWTPHFDLPQLKGVPLMGLLLDGDHLWIATQSRGLGLYRRGAKTFRWFDERDGMPDDWVTATAKFGGKIYAGTFVGGLARLDGEKWHVFENLRGENVTALAESGGRLMVATRTGVWEVQGDVTVKVEKPWLDSEVQALFAGKTGLWVGTRTSLNWIKFKAVKEAG